MARSEHEQGIAKPPGIQIGEVARVRKKIGLKAAIRPGLQGEPTNENRGKEGEHHLELRHDLAWIQYRFYGGEPTEDILAIDAAEMATVGIWLPTYLALRGKTPLDRDALPDHVMRLSETSQALYELICRFKTDKDLETNITPRDIYLTANDPRQPEERSFTKKYFICPTDQLSIQSEAKALLSMTDGDHAKSGLEKLLLPDEFRSLHAFSIEAQSYTELELETMQRQRRIIDEAAILRTRGAEEKDIRIHHILTEKLKLSGDIERARTVSQGKINIALGRNPLILM